MWSLAATVSPRLWPASLSLNLHSYIEVDDMRAHDLIVSHGRRATSELMFAADAVVLGIISTLQLIFYTFFSVG